MRVVNPRFAADSGSPMARAVDYSFGNSVAQSFPIATMRDNGEILIDVAPFLLSDWADLGAFFQGVATQRKLSGTIMLDRERSSMEQIRLFPGNLEARVRLTYQSNRNLGLETVSDYRWIPVGVHYSLLELPTIPMRPRYADERVGYFVSAIKDFSRDTAESFFVRYVNRWRMEKRDPTAAVSEPVTPIVYYIDRTVPTEWRPWVRAGILEWNRAFEEAGFRNAIQVLDAPDDTLWNAEDARYSTVRWTATNRSRVRRRSLERGSAHRGNPECGRAGLSCMDPDLARRVGRVPGPRCCSSFGLPGRFTCRRGTMRPACAASLKV